jgi:hypothetical protein
MEYDYECELTRLKAYIDYVIDHAISMIEMKRNMVMSFEEFKTFRLNKNGKLLINNYITIKIEDTLNCQLKFLAEIYKNHLRIDNLKLKLNNYEEQ